MFDQVRRLRRTARVVRTGAGIYLGYKRTARRARNMAPEAAAAAWERRHDRAAEAMYRLAIDLKGLYIKSGQYVGTRSDIAPAAYISWLSQLQDSVPPHPFAEVRRTVEGDLGRPIEEVFARFEQEPIASASLAQVHRAQLLGGGPDGGAEVVVKVQYPDVADLVRLDILNLRRLVRFVAWREPDFDFRAIVDEIERQAPLELDFVGEAEMTRRVRENMRAIDGVDVPEVIEGLGGPRVLVTRYVEGARLDSPQIVEWGVDRPALARRVAGVYGHQILIDGLFQGDPHPGNFIIHPDGRVTLLDFGLTKELSDHMRLAFARLIVAASRMDGPGVIAAFEDLGMRVSGNDPMTSLMFMARFFGERPAGALGGGAPLQNLQQVREVGLGRARLEVIPSDLVLLGRVTALLRGVCATLGAPLNPLAMLLPYAQQALATAEPSTSAAETGG